MPQQRLRILCRQVNPAFPGADALLHGEACASTDVKPGTRPEKVTDMPPEKVAALRQIMKVAAEADKLLTEGTWPSASFFDLGLVTKHEDGPPTKMEIEAFIDMAGQSGRLEVLDTLPGPWKAAANHEERVQAVQECASALTKGYMPFLYAKWQQRYGGRGLASNIVVPSLTSTGIGSNSTFGLRPRVIVADPGDARRIAQIHVMKEGNFEPVLFDGVIATTDNEHWLKQRQHLSEAFLPLSSLAAIMPVSLERAKQCATRLAEASVGGTAVDMSDFLLHEAQAQLQLALLGAPNELMEATNEKIRATFGGDLKKGEVDALPNAMKALMEVSKDPSLALPTDGCPVRGPLSRAVATSELPASANYGNMLLILFAGHDTTGHTMTWLMFELARNPNIQKALQAEADEFFKSLGGRDPEYRDLARLDLLDRCVTETLRMWPAVANGTFRQLQFDDTVVGPDGEEVDLPKGTLIQVVNWSRHRNPELWGSDADTFNPYRKFADSELARVGCPMAAVNPQSERFSPFTFSPRSCLGRNFAQLEMRLIMLHLVHRFTFTLAKPYDKLACKILGATPDLEGEFRGLNGATMGPMDLENTTKHWWGEKHYNGIKLHATERCTH